MYYLKFLSTDKCVPFLSTRMGTNKHTHTHTHTNKSEIQYTA